MKNYLTFDIGGTEIKYGVITEDYTILIKGSFPSKGTLGGKYILDDIILKASELNSYKPQGIAISSAGVVNSITGEILSATNTIVDYIGMNVIEYIQERTNLPVSILNDVNSMALCESTLGAVKDAKIAIALTIGTGIGGSIIINNRVFEGAGFNAGEFGLMKINELSFESLASTSALVSSVQKAFDASVENGVEVFKLYDNNEPEVVKQVHLFFDYLSTGIANLSYAFNPDVIVIGGGITARDSLISEIYAYLEPKLTAHLRKYTKLSAAKFRNDAGMIGAFIHFKNSHDLILT
jgi:predicted NBD/HSP70 family sugar kinase